MLLQADPSCFKFPEMIFEGEPQDGTAAYVELLDPHAQCDALRLSVGWLASFCRRAALSLTHRERTLVLSKRERQLGLSLSAFLHRRQRQREREFLLYLAELPQADSRRLPQSDSKMLLQADSSCFKFPELIFEDEPQDGIAAYVELLDLHVQCDALRLSVGWLGLLLSTSCPLSLPWRELSFSPTEREIQLAK